MATPVDPTDDRSRRQRPRPAHSPAMMSTTTTTTTDDLASGTEESASSLLRHDPQLAAVLGGLPSSSKELLRRIERQKDEIRLLQEENTRLRAREVEVSALTLRLQQQFGATQSQVDRLKSQIRMELMNPITEEEYRAIDSLEEGKRDLLDTVKLGIYHQLGSMRAAKDAAMQRATEMSTETTRLTRENKELQQRLKELEAVVEAERQSFRRQLQEVEQRGSSVVELEGKVRELESRLKNAYMDQEQFLTAKLNASVKTEEATRLGVRLREAEMEAERYKTSAECSEQKLDILKSEYYELKLKNSQRVMELEACLRGAEEKLKTLADLELESELFVSNLAMQSGGQVSLTTASVSAAAGGDGAPSAPSATDALSNYESWLALPRSRKLAHTLTVTKRCLQLENRLAAIQHDVEFKDKQIARLQASLDMAREALNNSNSPFAMVERSVERLTNENEELHNRTVILSEENTLLRQRLEQRTADVRVLCRHRKELLRIQRVLRRLGIEGQVADPAAAPRSQGLQQSLRPLSLSQQQQQDVEDTKDPRLISARSIVARQDPTVESLSSLFRQHAEEPLQTVTETETAAATEEKQKQAQQRSHDAEESSSGVFIPRPIQIIS
ncbi:hypothetical protein TcG_08847 [Trypanosoma cruzi]|uniref:Uncharacterized protein n=2 Tax=Trypanosoma cruzi TaxID=5693 RepID=V5BXW3_TRYCR|nr:hypothetical protein TCDM_01920 [Trypanosoma cruzi Dm28c]PBJ71723.1 hypothetical protein BCY84_16409 [Trypanosoma cruzi cruzi]PWU85416.1 hypothetical protein C4B63_163g23 [Trypanosoma cruzi]PBJ79919.1 hypothetical protein BCY84_02178 [Trypanosoma cruzi cruzi]PWU93604.1 hypothetical protein C4B63_30g263 [Trypanosoma cruzi]